GDVPGVGVGLGPGPGPGLGFGPLGRDPDPGELDEPASRETPPSPVEADEPPPVNPPGSGPALHPKMMNGAKIRLARRTYRRPSPPHRTRRAVGARRVRAEISVEYRRLRSPRSQRASPSIRGRRPGAWPVASRKLRRARNAARESVSARVRSIGRSRSAARSL